ncbi:MAG: ribonuclease HII, partial [Xanthomonadales bacterium]|nr:ribonuclease HII [Xanthomonadales bacterium]
MTRPERCAGVDEAGRGPLAGPVVVAAVVLPADHGLEGLDDSKRLPVDIREALEPQIREAALCWSVQVVEVAEIDQLNILRATFVGMQRAVAAL